MREGLNSCYASSTGLTIFKNPHLVFLMLFVAACLISTVAKAKQSPWLRPILVNQGHRANLCDPTAEEEMPLVIVSGIYRD